MNEPLFFTPEPPDDPPDLPPHLKPLPPGREALGTLSYNRKRRLWQVKARDLAVSQLCKRLFPGTDRDRRGVCHFPDHWRFVEDLMWLMQRYPLDVAPADSPRWEEALEGARTHALRRQSALAQPPAEPSPLHFEGRLLPFQRLGLSFLLSNPRSLLADEMGLGKTVQALAALSRLDRYPVLIVVPPHLLLNWRREIERFLRVTDEEGAVTAPTVHILRGLTPYALPQAHVYLVHYLLLRGWKKELPKRTWSAVLFDEIQELRRTGTEKYSTASLIAEAAPVVYGLSGTPIYNYGGEIWNVMNILDYHCLGDWESFTREWCAGYGRDRVLHPDVLGEHLRREALMLRRTKDAVLPELPPKRRVVQPIDADEGVFTAEMAEVTEKIRRLMALGADPSARALLIEQIAQDERQATGLAKAAPVCAFVRGLLEGGEKVLLFAHHHRVFDQYRKALHGYHPAFITGRETAAQKDKAVTYFTAGRTALCCISLRAASGLNLQQATCVVFGELDWSPAVHSQAEDRAHRMGQQDSVLCYYLVCARGSDQDMQDALGLKVSQFQGLMGMSGESGPEAEDRALLAAGRHVDRVIRRLTGEKDEEDSNDL